MGLYDVSMRRAQGELPSLGASIVCWRAHTRTMGMLVMVMIVLGAVVGACVVGGVCRVFQHWHAQHGQRA